jgi:hypothetical protein
MQEGAGSVTALLGTYAGEGHTTAIVDRNMYEVPADPVAARGSGLICRPGRRDNLLKIHS